MKADELLNLLREELIRTLEKKREGAPVKEGMDVALYILDREKMEVQFAGAYNPLIICSEGDLTEIKGDRMPVAIDEMRGGKPFTLHVQEVKQGNMLYTYSDGFQDQFGGPKNRKFMAKNFRQLLLDIHQKDPNEQMKILEETLLDWRGSHPQVDDVLVIGVRV